MILLAENNDYQLFKTSSYVSCNLIVFKKLQGFKQEVSRSMTLLPKVTKYFTKDQIKRARGILHTSKIAGLCFAK